MSSQALNATRRFPRQHVVQADQKLRLKNLLQTETWQNIHGHAIVAGERLQEKINKSVTCRFCQGSVQLVENLGSKSGLCSVWMFQCQNESCPSQECNLPFSTTEKRRAFAINRASVLGFRAIGGGHAAASKVFSFLGLSPIHKNSWADHTKKIEQETKLLLEDNLNRAPMMWKNLNSQTVISGWTVLLKNSKIPLLTLVSRSNACQTPIVIARWSLSGKHQNGWLGVIILLRLDAAKNLFFLFSRNENFGKLSVRF